MYTHEEVKEILFKNNLKLYEEYINLVKLSNWINKNVSISMYDVQILEKQAKKLGEEIMKITEEIIESKPKLTFIEVMIELESYIEDCLATLVNMDREYTNGYETVSVDWIGRVYVSELNDIDLSRRDWGLVS